MPIKSTRRQFLKGLVASVIAAGVVLPVGFPKPEQWRAIENLTLTTTPFEAIGWKGWHTAAILNVKWQRGLLSVARQQTPLLR